MNVWITCCTTFAVLSFSWIAFCCSVFQYFNVQCLNNNVLSDQCFEWHESENNKIQNNYIWLMCDWYVMWSDVTIVSLKAHILCHTFTQCSKYIAKSSRQTLLIHWLFDSYEIKVSNAFDNPANDCITQMQNKWNYSIITNNTNKWYTV